MPKVFISHSNQDRELTLFVVDALRRAGFDVWVDFENIRGGADWLCEIEAGIQRCDAVVTILSAASKASVWVERECLYAFQLKKPVVTALVADILIPLHLINIQYVDLRTAPADGSAKLVLALEAIFDRDSPTSDYPIVVPTREPAEANFFPYLEQFPGGETAMLVARDLFYWARGVADEVAFAGLIQPGFHARVNTASTMATVFSVWAYRRRPSAQLPLDLLAVRHPFDSRGCPAGST